MQFGTNISIFSLFLFQSQDIFKSNNCRTDYLEIRDGYWHKSPILGRYCGSGRIMELIKSSSSRMLLTLVTTHRQAGLRGFAASYEGMPILQTNEYYIYLYIYIYDSFEQLFVAAI